MSARKNQKGWWANERANVFGDGAGAAFAGCRRRAASKVEMGFNQCGVESCDLWAGQGTGTSPWLLLLTIELLSHGRVEGEGKIKIVRERRLIM